MKKDHYVLRELSKFFAGVVAADIIIGFWVLLQGVYAFPFLGIVFSPPPVYAWLTIDFILFIFLIHYGWKVSLPLKHPERAFFIVAGCLFLLVAVAHLLRVLFGVSFVVGDYSIPYWLNILGVIVTSFLGYTSLSFALNSKN